jgi:hypothetical protein
MLVSAEAQGQSLIEAARAFDEAALRRADDNARPTPIRKHTGPIRLAVRRTGMAPSLVEPSRQAVRSVASEAGVTVIDVEDDGSATFIITFDENELSSGRLGCSAQTRTDKNWSITYNDLRISPAHPSVDRCMVHEAMHAFGFNSHPHGADSILSYVIRRRDLTPLDRHLIRTLYDPRLPPGMPVVPGSQMACRILGERLASPAADIETACRDRKGPGG